MAFSSTATGSTGVDPDCILCLILPASGIIGQLSLASKGRPRVHLDLPAVDHQPYTTRCERPASVLHEGKGEKKG
jgi:hypothetical protein